MKRTKEEIHRLAEIRALLTRSLIGLAKWHGGIPRIVVKRQVRALMKMAN